MGTVIHTKTTVTKTQAANTGAVVRKQRGALLLHQKLREDIMWMAIAPGTALDEVSLAKTYDVSRTPVREALLLLEAEGFVHFLPNRSTIVAPLTMQNIPALFDTFLLLARAIVRSVDASVLADKDLRQLIETYRLNLSKNAHRQAFEAQISLYSHLACAAGNRFLEKSFLEVQDASVRLKQLHFFPYLTQDDQAQAYAKLSRIVDTVNKPDANACDAAVVASVMFELEVIQRSLAPTFGHVMDISTEAKKREGL